MYNTHKTLGLSVLQEK